MLAAAGILVCLNGAAAAGTVQEGDRYRPYSGIARGTEGVAAVPLVIANDGAGEIVCHAALAHWYSQELGRIAPGGTLAVTLWHDPAAGSLSVLNEVEDRMPVEAITCGPLARPAAARIALPFRAGPAPDGLAARCGPADGGFRCTAADEDDGAHGTTAAPRRASP